jgi:guanylate kinase
LPRVFVITGPSGVGKGTLIRTLVGRIPELELSVSATTRRPRLGETQGVDYHFLDDEEFERRVQAGEFLEHADYSGRRYGTLRSDLEQRLARGAPVVLEIEVQGALRERLIGRGTDSAEDVEKRLATAREELRAQGEFPHVVRNDRLEDAVAALEELVRAALGSEPTKPTKGPS